MLYIFILDATGRSLGHRYKGLLLQNAGPNPKVTCFIQESALKVERKENLYVMQREKENEYASWLKECHYMLVLQNSNNMHPLDSFDQVRYAKERSGKIKIISVNADQFRNHTKISCNSVPEYIEQLENQQNQSRQRSKIRARGQSDLRGKILCPNCKTEISVGVTNCPVCGREIPDYIVNAVYEEQPDTLGNMVEELPKPQILLVSALVIAYISASVFIRYGMKVWERSFTNIIYCILGIFIVLFSILHVWTVTSEKEQAKNTFKTDDQEKTVSKMDGNHIFISYKHGISVSAKLLKALTRKINEAQMYVWTDEKLSGHVGEGFDDEIANQIAECQYFVALIDEEYVKSEYCLDELLYARCKNKIVIPIYLGKIPELPSGIEMRLIRLQSMIFAEDSDEDKFFNDLIRRIKKKVRTS